MDEAIQTVAYEYTRLTYSDQDRRRQRYPTKTPYIISLSDALIFMGLKPINSLNSPSFILLRDTYLMNPLYNFIYANSLLDQDGHYIYGSKKGAETLYFTIQGLKYFSIIYPSTKQSIIALYYISLESTYLKFSRDAEEFLL
jgi:hypothetical protein